MANYSPQPEYAAPVTSKAAIFSLVLGILSFCVPIILGIPAVILGIVGLVSIGRAKGRVTGSGLAVGGIITGAISIVMIGPIMVGLLMVAVQKAREAGNRAQSLNNLHQIALAIHTYADSNGGILPRDAPGQGLSWRVHMLPFYGEQKLYSQFHLNEPWDSPHNIKLLPLMPKVYLNPRFQGPEDVQKGLTYYRGFRGPGTVLGGDTDLSFGAITAADGTANTLLVVEAGDPVPWTKPDDLVYAPDKPLPRFGGPFGGRFSAAFCDGHVANIPADIDERSMRAMITYNDMQPVNAP